MNTHPFQSGANIDTRSHAEREKDPKFHELVASANPVTWIEKDPNACRKFPIFNQDGSGSCVAQTTAKELGIMRFLKDGVYVHFSATHAYQQRTNKPAGGMSAADANTAAGAGVTLEVLAPSQNMSDAQMDAEVIEPYKVQVGAVFAGPQGVELPHGDIDTVASVIQTTQKGVKVWFFFQIDEWTDRPIVIHNDLTLIAGLRHSVTAVDFLLIGGVKHLVIEDSWGTSFGVAGQRFISEAFFKTRNWYASYFTSFKFDLPISTKPHHTFAVDLSFGMTNLEVTALQDCLKFEGLFPNNAQSTGYFGAVTKQAVQAFQTRYGIMSVGNVGPQTRAKLNSIYGV